MIRPENSDCRWRERGFKTADERREKVAQAGAVFDQKKQADSAKRAG